MFFVLSCFCANAKTNHLPEKTITGKVTDSATGQPLGLVSIKVQGKKTATTSNQLGIYSITADDNDVLSFSYIGYETQSVKVDGVKQPSILH